LRLYGSLAEGPTRRVPLGLDLLLGNRCQPVGIVCYFLNGSKPVQLAEALAA
jgi:hypothetical protein